MSDASEKNLQSLYQQLGDTSTDVRNKNLYALIIPHLKGKTLLDIGCGAGHFMHLAKEKGYRVEGVEPDQVLVEMSRKLYGVMGAIYPDDERLKSVRKKYDTVTLIDVLEHIKDDRALLALIRQKLSPEGRLVILVPAYQFLYSERDRSIGHFRRYYASQLVRMLESVGYEVRSVRHWNMLGFFVYAFFEKVLKKRAPHHMRTSSKKTGIKRLLHGLVHLWMKYVEHRFNLGFGLSILVVAELEKE